jgi:hypothetical protein
MKKYYIGFAVLMAVVLVSFIYAITQASAAKADHTTNQAIEDISGKLDSYAAANGVPGSLAAANIKNAPSTIKYTKLSDSEYKICVTYKTAASGFDAGWAGLFLGGIGDSSFGNSTDDSYFNPTVETKHKKGENCQTVKPYSYNYYGTDGSSSSGSSSGQYQGASSACISPSFDLNVTGSITVSRVDAATKTIYFDPGGQYVYDYSVGGAAGETVPTISSKKYDDKTVFCDGKTLKTTDISSVKAGNEVMIYLKSASDSTLSQVELTYLLGN